MTNRFPPLRPQSALSRPSGRTIRLPAPVDLVLLAVLAFMMALALL